VSTSGEVLGAVLAGGASRRFGRDKSAEEIDGTPMIERAFAALSVVCDDVLVVSSREDTPRGRWRTVPDLRPGQGPLAGIEAALDHAVRDGFAAALVLACDLPLVGHDTLEALIAASEGGSRVVAVSRRGDPDFEPLCAVYPTSGLDAVTALLDDGERAAQAAYRRLGGRVVPASDSPSGADVMLNVNTPADADRARQALGGAESGG